MNVSVSGFGNGMLALLRHPEQLQRLRNDPSLIPAALEELLRFDSPIQADFRRVLADCEVNGFALRKRDNVVLLRCVRPAGFFIKTRRRRTSTTEAGTH